MGVLTNAAFEIESGHPQISSRACTGTTGVYSVGTLSPDEKVTELNGAFQPVRTTDARQELVYDRYLIVKTTTKADLY